MGYPNIFTEGSTVLTQNTGGWLSSPKWLVSGLFFVEATSCWCFDHLWLFDLDLCIYTIYNQKLHFLRVVLYCLLYFDMSPFHTHAHASHRKQHWCTMVTLRFLAVCKGIITALGIYTPSQKAHGPPSLHKQSSVTFPEGMSQKVCDISP